MSQQYFDNLEALIAQSNLVPTAGEFVPRTYSLQPPEQSFQTRQQRSNQTLYSRQSEYSSSNTNEGTSVNRQNRISGNSQEGRLWRDGDRSGGRYREQRRDFESSTNGTNTRKRPEGESGQRPVRLNSNEFPRGRPKHNNGERVKRQSAYYDDETSKVPSEDVPPNASSRRYNNGGQSRYYSNRQNFDKPKNHNFNGKKKVDFGRNDNNVPFKEKNQLEALVALLTKGELECLVCYEHVKQTQSTWSCHVCHHVLHLRCVIKWARSSRTDKDWRCPACRHVFDSTPAEYRCFCGKTVDPTWNRSDCPHTCGSICGLSRADPCPHRCTLPCHPGPCPPCRLFLNRSCGCGRDSRTVQCADLDAVVCGATCDRPLNCQQHKCKDSCHAGECSPCSENIHQECFCGKTKKEVPCTAETVSVLSFCCGEICSKKLNCSNHLCTLICHSGPCPPCPFLPENASFCPCGQTLLTSIPAAPRKTCLDPLPTCGALCSNLLPCGEPGNRHQCSKPCHEGPCPDCPSETMIRCRCGHMNKTVPCAELASRADDVRCEKKCNKKRSCGKHKCREVCCIDPDHICVLPCTRTLSCGIHRCEEPCHSAYCRPCPRMSFEELLCECGAEVILPPVPCGVRRPPCSRPCSRRHTCSHTPTHNCHSDVQCPPCTVLVAKRCHGGHELRKAVPCHLESFSCGLACGLPMPCKRHTCILPCHEGACSKDDVKCQQPCTVARSSCGHNCGAPCHEPPCPDLPCKEMVKVTCECGHRFSTRSCVDNAREYQRIATIQLASKMADLAAGQTVDLNIFSRKISYKTLECSEECKVIERNRRLAVGLQIRNPDLSAKLTPRYSDFLRGWAKKDARFCQMVHEKLSELVKLAKDSKQKSRSFSFDAMNREKRHFIHEYCEHFGCDSVAYDQEPHRNIVATALRDKSWLPSISLLEVIQRENGARKVPLPNVAKIVPTQKSMEVLSARGATSSAWAEPTFPSQSGT